MTDLLPQQWRRAQLRLKNTESACVAYSGYQFGAREVGPHWRDYDRSVDSKLIAKACSQHSWQALVTRCSRPEASSAEFKIFTPKGDSRSTSSVVMMPEIMRKYPIKSSSSTTSRGENRSRMTANVPFEQRHDSVTSSAKTIAMCSRLVSSSTGR